MDWKSNHMKRYQVAFFGATAWTIGFVAAHTDTMDRSDDWDAPYVVLEESAILSPEFAGAYRAEPITTPVTKEGMAFRDDLTARNLLASDGRISIPAVTPHFARTLLASGTTTLCMTHIYETVRTDGGYIVRYVNTDGYGELFCETIMDTRSPVREDTRISLRAMLTGHGCPVDGYDKGGIRVLHGRFDSEYILAMDCENDGFAARALYRKRWAQMCHTDFAGWETAAIASYLAYEYPAPFAVNVAEEYRICPSAAYSNVMAAYEGGAAYVL